ncbi:alkaline phosphatase PafA [Aquimarina sp. MMG016]|uniref:alkaline phosphatase PafA n=1 Tax=Aquimarina sp. MMG016 TaxID=2822690 RepID=UPI001B3A2BF0|nr:alkaline phosphatase PafA [Aquimarina sp. MMG016]MBQ4820573.1 alkaline phosphatase family protein [Aquimarina sp. MMG016]
MIFRVTSIIVLFFFSTSTQQRNENGEKKIKPKLVVGIVVDQMRYDYLTRFYDRFGEGGFKRMIKDGFSCKNHHIDYIPTTTAPGHASIFTGTTPKNHGIIGNTWYNKISKQKVYCVEDNTVSPVGTSSFDGKMSPTKLKNTTIADQNRLHTQMRGKTISIAIKDRGAILSGGHTANAAYWFRGKGQGSWISSSYYMNKLPRWVVDFNESNIIDSYFKDWDTLYEIDSYTSSGPDDTQFERGFKGKEKAIFPYNLQRLKEFNSQYDIIKHTPFGNSLTIDFAVASITEEELGKDNNTDFLTISFSSTDYIGHNFGVNSKEVEDTYLRLDKDIERLLLNLDKKVGKNQYTVFLTSDHGATQVPQYLKSIKVPSGYFKEATVYLELKNHIKSFYKTDSIIESITNNQVFLNYRIIKKNALDAEEIQQRIAKHLLQSDKIAKVYTRTQLQTLGFSEGIGSLIQKGFNLTRSGDVCYILNPGVIAYARTGSAHGSGYNYDTHIPLLFYGRGIKPGKTFKKTTVSDIAPTIATLLDINLPNASSGNILNEVFD